MKLIICDECRDMVALRLGYGRYCHCGLSYGRYQDPYKVVVAGPCRVIQLENGLRLGTADTSEASILREPSLAIIRRDDHRREVGEQNASVYPCTIIKDRYSGTYSGGVWTAWMMDPTELQGEAWGDDISCADFWSDAEASYGPVGLGATPEEAYRDLRAKLGLAEEEEPEVEA